MTDDRKRPAAPAAPDELGVEGLRLWASVTADFDLGPDELESLREACRCADELERLRQAVADSPLTTAGSAGQLVAHPLLEQVRRHRDLLGKLLERLALPSGDEDQGMTPAQKRAHRAAQQRWRDRQAVRDAQQQRGGRRGSA